MFRYELQTINRKHYFVDERKNDVYMFGSHPLSKCEGMPIKELLKKVKGEMFKNRD